MIRTSGPLHTELKHSHVLINNDLEISFRRTIRVPDNNQTSNLPPDLGAFPLKPISKYVGKVTPDMAAKGGLLLPMYRKSK